MYDVMNHAFAKICLAAMKNAENTLEPDVEKCRKAYIPWQHSEKTEGLFRKVMLKEREQETIDI